MVDVNRDCMSNRIQQLILERIRNGVYGPGDRLVELQIARELNTSQAPIREALCKLEAMRIVETQPYKGTHVRRVSHREFEESLQIRGVLENLAAEQVENRLRDSIDELRQTAMATLVAAKEQDLDAYRQSNLKFHRMIVEASNNQTLIMVWDSLVPEVRMRMQVNENTDCSSLLACANDHLEIVEAFAEGDNRYAGKLLKKHAESILFHYQHHEPVSKEA
jgi:DNA-binding GntR family transcriptional regulator